MKKIRQLNKRIMGVLLMLSMFIVAAPVAVSQPEEAKADSAGTTYIDGIGRVTILYESAAGYKYCLDQNQNLFVTGKYYSSPYATTSYHTQRLYFTREPSGMDPTSCPPFYSVTPDSHTTTSPDSQGYVKDTYKISNQKLTAMLKFLFADELDMLKEAPQTIYMSEGFSLKTRKSASDKNWNIQSSPIYASYADMLDAGNGKWQWSSDTQYDLMSHYDAPINLDYNALIGPDPDTGKKYKLTVSEEGNGLVSGSTGEYYAGTSVYEMAQPDNGYRFVEWKGDKSGIADVDWTSDYIRFDMPRRDVHLTAVFEKVDGTTPVPTKAPVEDEEMEEKDPNAGNQPTPIPEPTPTPKPSYPTEDRIIYENTYRAFTTDKGYTWQTIREKGGYLPNHTSSKYWQMSRYAKADTAYSVGTDADGNTWYFIAEGVSATYVHPNVYKGYNANTDEVRFITELTFPSKITCNGTTYTVTSIGGGTNRYAETRVVQNTSSWSESGVGSGTYEAYSPLTGSYTYESVLASNANYTATEGCGSNYWVGVIGNGGISGSGSQYKEWPSTGAKHTNDYAQSYNVYNTTLKQVTIPNTVVTVMSRAFYGCQALTKISGGDGLQNIGKEAFPAMLNEIEISEQKSSDQYNIYQYNESYSFDSYTQTMKDYKKTMTLPDYLQLAEFPRLKSVGERAFVRRTNLHDVVLTSALIEICKDAFLDCLLTSIKIPGATTKIHSTTETLGTAGRGDKRTTIITVPESTAMYYGMDQLYYYKLRCGYKITYRNNFEPAETYETTAEFREIYKNPKCVFQLGTKTTSALIGSGTVGGGGVAGYSGKFFLISEDGVAYICTHNEDGPATGKKIELLQDYRIDEVVDEIATKVVVAVNQSGTHYQTNYSFILRTTTGEFFHYRPCDYTQLDGTESFSILNIPKDAYQLQFTQLISSNSGANTSYTCTSSPFSDVGYYVYYLRTDGRIYRTKYRNSEGNWLATASQTVECVSVSTDKRFESFVINAKNYIGSRDTLTRSSDTYYIYSLNLPKIFAKTDEGEYVCGYHIVDTARKRDSSYNYGFNQEEWNKGPDASFYEWVPTEPYRDIKPLAGSDSDELGLMITEDGTLLAIHFSRFISRSTDTGSNIYYLTLDTENSVKMKYFESVPSESNYIKGDDGYIYLVNGSQIWTASERNEASSTIYRTFTITLKHLSNSSKASVYISEDIDIVMMLYGSDSYSYSGGGFSWSVTVVIDDKDQIWRDGVKIGAMTTGIKFANMTSATHLIIQDDNLNYWHTSFGPYAKDSVPPRLLTEEDDLGLWGKLTRALTHYPTVLVGWEYLETIYDNMFSRNGYTFLHWNTAADDSGDKYYPGVDVSVNKAISLYGQWEKTVNKVRYHSNGGSGMMEDSTCDPLVTKKVTLSECLYVKEGHGFVGWNTKQDGSGTMYQPGATFTTTQAVTYLYAQWEPMDYVLKVATDDVRVRPVTSTSYNMKYNQEFTIPAALPNRAFTVDYRLNPKNTMSTTPKFKTATPLSDAYTKAQLTFEGWMLYEEVLLNSHYEYLNRFYTPGQKDKNFAVHKQYTPVLFPTWGGVASYVNLPVAECNGYWFIGWTENANETDEAKVIHAEDGSGAMYQPKGNETLYAFYQPIEYDIDLIVDVEDAAPGEITVTQTEVTMTFDEQIPGVGTPVSDVYIFMGYYDKVDADGVPTADAVQYYDENGNAAVDAKTGKPLVWTVYDGSVTALYAYFISEIEVTLDGRGATKQEQTSVTMTYEKVGPNVIPPEKTGYTFQGYYTGTRGSGKKYFDANGKGCAVWLEKKTDILYAYWVQNPVELPEQNPTEDPDVLPEERVVIEASLDSSRVHIYADDNDPTTGAMTDVQPYLVSDVVIDGTLEAAGAIPSTENVAIRAKMGAWLLSSVLERRTGVDYVRVYVTVPYRTQYEDAETEELIISDIQYATYDFMVPKAWSYWVVADGGIYFPEKVVVENEALSGGGIEIQVAWEAEGAIEKPSYQIKSYGEKDGHLSFDSYDSDGTPRLSLTASGVQYIISDKPGSMPDITKHLKIIGSNTAWADNTQFTVKSDGFNVAGETLLSDVSFDDGNGAIPDRGAIARVESLISETAYSQAYQSGVPIVETMLNGCYSTNANTIYVADDSNEGEHQEIRVAVREVNELNIHTPVVCDGALVVDDSEYGNRSSIKQNNEDKAMVILESYFTPFTVLVRNSGSHRMAIGYGDKDFTYAMSGKTNLSVSASGTLMNQVKFPIDVYFDKNTDSFDVSGNIVDTFEDMYIPANTWVSIGDAAAVFYIPVTQDTGEYTVEFRTIAANCPKDANGHYVAASAEFLANINATKYIATDTLTLSIKSGIVDLVLTGTNDKAAAQKYIDGENILTMSKGYYYNYVIKTAGDELLGADAEITISPKYDYITPDGKYRVGASVYYSEVINGARKRFVQVGSGEDHQNMHSYSNRDTVLNVPNSLLTLTEQIAKEKGFAGRVTEIFTFDEIRFNRYLRMYPGIQKTIFPVGYCTLCYRAYLQGEEIACGHGSMLEKTSSLDGAEKAVQEWYGMFYLPADSYIITNDTKEGYCSACKRNRYVREGRTVCPEHGIELETLHEFDFATYVLNTTISGSEEFFVKDGYLAINYDVEMSNGATFKKPYKEWDELELAQRWQSSDIAYKTGDIVLYRLDRTIYDDYEIGGTE